MCEAVPHLRPVDRVRDDGRTIAERSEPCEAIMVLGLAALILTEEAGVGPELRKLRALHGRLLSRSGPPRSAGAAVTLLHASVTRIRATLDQDAS